MSASLIPHRETEGAGRFVPKRAHLSGMGAELLGRVRLDPARVEPHLSTWPIPRAIQYDWTIAYAAMSPNAPGIEVGAALSSLMAAE